MKECVTKQKQKQKGSKEKKEGEKEKKEKMEKGDIKKYVKRKKRDLRTKK